MKSFYSVLTKILLALSFVLGIFGLIIEAIGKLPDDFYLPPAVFSFLALLPLVLNALNWQDELEEGKRSIIEKIKAFFQNPYRKLLLTVVLTLFSGLAQLPDLSPTLQNILTVVGAIIAALELQGAEARLERLSEMRSFAKLNGFTFKLRG